MCGLSPATELCSLVGRSVGGQVVIDAGDVLTRVGEPRRMPDPRDRFAVVAPQSVIQRRRVPCARVQMQHQPGVRAHAVAPVLSTAIHTVVAAGIASCRSSFEVNSTSPAGSGIGSSPTFVTLRSPSRRKAITWRSLSIHSKAIEPESRCLRIPSAVRNSSSVDPSTPVWASTDSSEKCSGWGSHESPAPKPSDGPIGGPRDGHSAAVSTAPCPTTALPDGIVEHVLGQIDDLGQSQFLALVQVRGAREGEHEQRACSRPPQPQIEVEVGERVRHERCGPRVRWESEARHRSDHIMVGHDPGGGGALVMPHPAGIGR